MSEKSDSSEGSIDEETSQGASVEATRTIMALIRTGRSKFEVGKYDGSSDYLL